MDESKRRNNYSRREFLPTAAWLGGSLLRAEQKNGGAAADAERKSAVLSADAISVIDGIAARSVIPSQSSGKDHADNVAIITRDCTAVIQACRKQKLHKIEFRGNLVHAASTLLQHFQGPPMLPWIDGLKEAGFMGVDINMGLFPWYNQDRANMDKLEKAVERIHADGLRAAFNPELDGHTLRLPDWESYTNAALKVWPMLAKRFQPAVLMVTHEPWSLSMRLGFMPTIEQWTDFVRRTAAAVKEASPKTQVGVGFVPAFKPDFKFVEPWITLPDFELISVDIYSFGGMDRVNQVVAAAKKAGKGVFIEETWRPRCWTKETELKYPGNYELWRSSGEGLDIYEQVDALWIEMVGVYAATWGMEAVVPMYTQTLFKYDPVNGNIFEVPYNTALVKALLAGERTKTFYTVQKIIRELGKTRAELA